MTLIITMFIITRISITTLALILSIITLGMMGYIMILRKKTHSITTLNNQDIYTRHYDAQHNFAHHETGYDNTEYKGAYYNDTQHTDTQHNDTQYMRGVKHLT
jgi:hypothetical protein